MDFDTYIVGLDARITAKINLFLGVLHSQMAIITATLFIIYVVYKVLNYFANIDKGLDPYTLVRPCIILACVVLYKPLVEIVLIVPVKLIGDVIIDTILQVYGGDITQFNDKFVSGMHRVSDDTFTVLQVNPILELFHLVLYFVGGFIANYMLIRQLVTLGVYHILGYFSMIFSLIPGNENSIKNWILTYIAVLLWRPVIYMIKYLTILTNIDSESFSSFLTIIAIQISIVFMIFKVPKFCEFLVNGGSPLGSPIGGSPIQNAKQIGSAISGTFRKVLSAANSTKKAISARKK